MDNPRRVDASPKGAERSFSEPVNPSSLRLELVVLFEVDWGGHFQGQDQMVKRRGDYGVQKRT